MRVLVTGGAGFIGSHVVERLLANGHEVEVIDDLSAGTQDNLPKAAKLHALDVRSAEAAEAVKKFEPEAVIHLAAQIDLRRSVVDPITDAEVNVIGSVRMLDAAVQAGAKNFVFASSSAVYGREPMTPTSEIEPVNPASPYGAAKASVENYLKSFRVMSGLHCAALRFANVYGPRQGAKGEGGVISVFAKNLIVGRPCRINGSGEQTRDFIFVGDVAKLIVAAAEQGLDDVFNVSTGKETKINELYAILSEIAGVSGQPEYVVAIPNETRRSCLTNDKAVALGWHPGVLFTEGLRQTWQWFQSKNA